MCGQQQMRQKRRGSLHEPGNVVCGQLGHQVVPFCHLLADSGITKSWALTQPGRQKQSLSKDCQGCPSARNQESGRVATTEMRRTIAKCVFDEFVLLISPGGAALTNMLLIIVPPKLELESLKVRRVLGVSVALGDMERAWPSGLLWD